MLILHLSVKIIDYIYIYNSHGFYNPREFYSFRGFATHELESVKIMQMIKHYTLFFVKII